jgi:hypothetical protein
MKIALTWEKGIALGIAVDKNGITLGLLFWVLDVKF